MESSRSAVLGELADGRGHRAVVESLRIREDGDATGSPTLALTWEDAAFGHWLRLEIPTETSEASLSMDSSGGAVMVTNAFEVRIAPDCGDGP